MIDNPKIYCHINGGTKRNIVVVAVAEDGTFLASHMSSSVGYAKHDIGITSDWKHDIYKNHYPNGYELVWIDEDEVDTHEGLSRAAELNHQKYDE